MRHPVFVYTCVVFLHFLARASNGRQYFNFENKCPKLGTGTPEDLTNLGDSLDFDPSGFVLLYKYLISYMYRNSGLSIEYNWPQLVSEISFPAAVFWLDKEKVYITQSV